MEEILLTEGIEVLQFNYNLNDDQVEGLKNKLELVDFVSDFLASSLIYITVFKQVFLNSLLQIVLISLFFVNLEIKDMQDIAGFFCLVVIMFLRGINFTNSTEILINNIDAAFQENKYLIYIKSFQLTVFICTTNLLSNLGMYYLN